MFYERAALREDLTEQDAFGAMKVHEIDLMLKRERKTGLQPDPLFVRKGSSGCDRDVDIARGGGFSRRMRSKEDYYGEVSAQRFKIANDLV